jgi:peptide/nickel transport system substrate-binding protein
MSRPSMQVLGVATAALMVATPALAQKSKDTLRYPTGELRATIDPILSPGPHTELWGASIYDNLLGFDPKAGQFKPLLAKSWSQPDPTTYEFTLRDDVKFHDGEKFDADDVVHTIGYIIDPKTRLGKQAKWAWIKSVEKMGPYVVRIYAEAPTPDALMLLVEGTPIYPEHLHGPVANKEDFGAKPIGTGPYRITKIDRNAGIVAKKNEYFTPMPTKRAAAIGTVEMRLIPSQGTVVAELLAGNVDIGLDLPIDQALSLKKTGRFDVTLAPPRVGYNFLQFPSAAWKNVPALRDSRVRKAIAMAIDRKALNQEEFGLLAGQVGEIDGLCRKEQLGCGYTLTPPAYDPAGAKKLLVEAGYADGFDVGISCYADNVGQSTLIAGMLRQIGIRASVKQIHSSQRRQFATGGQIEIGYLGWSGGGNFTVSPTVVRLFMSDETVDPKLVELAEPVLSVVDDAERRKAAAKVFDYYSEQSYGYVMHAIPEVFTTTSEVAIRDPQGLRPARNYPHEFYWK